MNGSEILWKSPKTIVSDWMADSGMSNLASSTDIKKWANEKIKSLQTSETYSLRLVLMKVDAKGYAVGPEDFKSVVQAGYGFHKVNKYCTREEVVKWVGEDKGCKFKVEIDCPKCHKSNCNCSEPFARFDANVFDISGHPEWSEQHKKKIYLGSGHLGGPEYCGYNDNFLLMRPTTNTFHAAKYHIHNCVNLISDSAVEYDLDMNERMGMQLNISNCTVLLAYSAYRMEGGFFMVPDIQEVWDAIKFYIDSKIMYRRWTKEPKMREYKDAYFEISALATKSSNIARIRLNMIPARLLKSIWENNVGKQVPNWDNEANLYRETPDQFQPWI